MHGGWDGREACAQGMWSGMVAWYQNGAVGGVFARTRARATVAADADPPTCHAVNEVGAHPCAPVVSDRGRARGQRYGHAKACPYTQSRCDRQHRRAAGGWQGSEPTGRTPVRPLYRIVAGRGANGTGMPRHARRWSPDEIASIGELRAAGRDPSPRGAPLCARCIGSWRARGQRYGHAKACPYTQSRCDRQHRRAAGSWQGSESTGRTPVRPLYRIVAGRGANDTGMPRHAPRGLDRCAPAHPPGWAGRGFQPSSHASGCSVGIRDRANWNRPLRSPSSSVHPPRPRFPHHPPGGPDA